MTSIIVSSLPLIRVPNGASASSRESKSEAVHASSLPASIGATPSASAHASPRRDLKSAEELPRIRSCTITPTAEKQDTRSAPLSERKETRFPRLVPLNATALPVSIGAPLSSASMSSAPLSSVLISVFGTKQ